MAINPSSSQVHIDRPNTNVLVAEMQDTTAYQAGKLMAVQPTAKQSDLYFKMPADQWLRTGAQESGPASEAPAINYSIGTQRFSCKVYKVRIDLDDITQANYDAPLDPEKDAAELLANDMLLKRESVCYQAIMQPNYWKGWSAPSDAPGVTRDFEPGDPAQGRGYWDQPNANPTADVAMLIKRIGRKGRRANSAWMARNVADALKNNPAVYGRFTGVTPQFLADDQLATILGLERLFISDVCINTAQERQLGKFGYLLDNEMLLFYSEPQASRYKPSFAYGWAWTGLPGAGGMEAVIREYRRENIASTTKEAWAAYSFEPVCDDLAVKLVNVLKNPT